MGNFPSYGTSDRQKQALEDKRVGLLEQQIGNKQKLEKRDQVKKLVDENYKQAVEYLKQSDIKKIPRDDPNVAGMMKSFHDSSVRSWELIDEDSSSETARYQALKQSATLAQIQAAKATGEGLKTKSKKEAEAEVGTFGAPKSGINPETLLPEQFVADKQGNVKWLGTAPLPKEPLVRIDNRPPGSAASRKASEAFGTGIGENATKRITYANSAAKQNAQLDIISLALQEGARTGYGEESILSIRSALETIGLKFGEGVGKEELIRTISNEMALRLRNPDSGLGLTGNTSNRDLEFLKNSVVGLGRTEAGNIEIIKMLKKFNDLTQAVALEQSKIIMENGGDVPVNLDSQLLKYVDNYKFFTEDERKRIDALTGKGVYQKDGWSIKRAD